MAMANCHTKNFDHAADQIAQILENRAWSLDQSAARPWPVAARWREAGIALRRDTLSPVLNDDEYLPELDRVADIDLQR